MNDSERLEWIAHHVHQIEVGSSGDPITIRWYDNSGDMHKTVGPRTASWGDTLRYAVDDASRSMPNTRPHGGLEKGTA